MIYELSDHLYLKVVVFVFEMRVGDESAKCWQNVSVLADVS